MNLYYRNNIKSIQINLKFVAALMSELLLLNVNQHVLTNQNAALQQR